MVTQAVFETDGEAMRSVWEPGDVQEAETDSRTQEQLSAARLELWTRLHELTAAAVGVSKGVAVHQYAVQAESYAAAEAAEAAGTAVEIGAELDMLA